MSVPAWAWGRRCAIWPVTSARRARCGYRSGSAGAAGELAPAVEHALVQIAQEGLWNVVRHASAAQAWLNLQYRTGETRLIISDDGHGDPAAARRHLAGEGTRDRYGLRIMAERAGELGGAVRAPPSRGWPAD